MNKFYLFFLILFSPLIIFAQANCGNPVLVNICPTTNLTNQTNAGMLDDSPTPCNIVGEDLVYKIYTQNNTSHIYASILNSTGPSKLTMKAANCSSSWCLSYFA